MLNKLQVEPGKVSEMYNFAGGSDGYAAEQYLKCSFQVLEDSDILKVQQQFYDAVVSPVQATYLKFFLHDSAPPPPPPPDSTSP